MNFPTHCEECGVLLQGGATRHLKTCWWYPHSYMGIVEAKSSKTYQIFRDLVGQYVIRCLKCGSESYNLGDIENRYCGHCHQFHELLQQ